MDNKTTLIAMTPVRDSPGSDQYLARAAGASPGDEVALEFVQE